MLRASLMALELTAGAVQAWAPANPQLLTRWSSDVSPTNVHPEHP